MFALRVDPCVSFFLSLQLLTVEEHTDGSIALRDLIMDIKQNDFSFVDTRVP
jgi:hypothetical protein